MRDKVIAASPCDGVRLPERRKPQVVIPPLEVLDVLAANLPAQFRVVPELVARCGLRQGELFGLEVEAVDFLRGDPAPVVGYLAGCGPRLWGCRRGPVCTRCAASTPAS